MSFLGKLAQGVASGAGEYFGEVARTQMAVDLEERKANILARRAASLEQAKAQWEAQKQARDFQYDVAKNRDGAVLAQAEREAESLGYTKGSEEWAKHLRDRTLGAQGPTAARLTERGQDITEDNNIRSTATSAENSERSAKTSTANSIRSTTTSQANTLRTQAGQMRRDAAAIRAGRYQNKRRGRGGGGPVARGANGETITWNGKNWIDKNGKVVG